MNSLDKTRLDSKRSSILSNYSLIVLNQKFQAYLQNRRTKEELYTLRLQYFTAFVLILIILSIIFMFIYALTTCDFKQTDISGQNGRRENRSLGQAAIWLFGYSGSLRDQEASGLMDRHLLSLT